MPQEYNSSRDPATGLYQINKPINQSKPYQAFSHNPDSLDVFKKDTFKVNVHTAHEIRYATPNYDVLTQKPFAEKNFVEKPSKPRAPTPFMPNKYGSSVKSIRRTLGIINAITVG